MSQKVEETRSSVVWSQCHHFIIFKLFHYSESSISHLCMFFHIFLSISSYSLSWLVVWGACRCREGHSSSCSAVRLSIHTLFAEHNVHGGLEMWKTVKFETSFFCVNFSEFWSDRKLRELSPRTIVACPKAGVDHVNPKWTFSTRFVLVFGENKFHVGLLPGLMFQWLGLHQVASTQGSNGQMDSALWCVFLHFQHVQN